MRIVEKKLSEIKPYDKNPRRNNDSVDKVAESIRQFGFQQPIVVDKDLVIICGHTRYEASKQLGLKVVPCVVADELSDQQVKAYRLADNKVGESSTWDSKLLIGELEDIFEFDMSEFGFPTLEETSDDEESAYYGDERERTFEAYNMYDVDSGRLTEQWQMPVIKATNHVPEDLISFNYAKTSKDVEKGIHFYIDDYQFERIWNAPHDYIEVLKKFDCVLTPDFSLYLEMPLPVQIWNVYRSRLIGQIMQDAGITVIPTLQWCMPNSFDFAFDGIEPGGTVSVSTIGVKRDADASKIWFDGMNAAMERLKPKTVVVYGGDIGYDFGNTEVVYIGNHNTERFGNV